MPPHCAWYTISYLYINIKYTLRSRVHSMIHEVTCNISTSIKPLLTSEIIPLRAHLSFLYVGSTGLVLTAVPCAVCNAYMHSSAMKQPL